MTQRLNEIIDQQVQAATSSKRDASILRRHLAAHCWTDRNHTITGLICCAGRHEKDWSADYRLYSREPLPTPEELRKDKSVPWQEATIKRNGRKMTIRYKRIQRVKWQPAGEKHTVQVVVVAPLRRKRYASGQWSYTDPAFLLCTDPDLSIEALLEAYTVRWGIEVNFREEKQLFGIGHAQVRQSRRVMTTSVVAIAAYAALLLAGREEFQDGHRPSHLRSGRWQRRWKFRSYRTSDLRQQLHHEAFYEQIDSLSGEPPCPAPIKLASALPPITPQKP